MFGTKDVPFAERGMLICELPNAVPEAFEMVLNYIYTDRIDSKGLTITFTELCTISFSYSNRPLRGQRRPLNDGHLPAGSSVFDSSVGAGLRTVFGVQDLEIKRVGRFIECG